MIRIKSQALKKYTSFKFVSAVIIVAILAGIGAHFLFNARAASPLVLGVYEGPGNVSGIGSFANETKSPIGIAADYSGGTSWSAIESSWPGYTWTGSPYQLQLGVPMLPSSGASLATGATGAYNSYFTTLAQNLVSAGESNAILRLGWEWDQTSNSWYAGGSATDATNFAAYWRQIVTAMRAVPGANFNYSWYYGAAYSNGVPGPASAITMDAYPGSAYVSSIALDFYDQTWSGSCNLPYNVTVVPTPASQMVTAAESNCAWNNSMLPQLNGLASFAASQNKPIGFGEWGVITRSDGHGLGDDPTFVNNFANWMKANNVTYASYFDFNSGGNSILANYPQSLAAFTSNFGSSSGSTTPPVSPPSVPTTVSATVNSSTSVTVAWTASTDTGGPGLGGYSVLRNGSQVAQVTSGTSYTDKSVSPSTSYSYTVEAYDKASPPHVSYPSTAASVTTPATPPPSTPTNLKASVNSATSVALTWTASTDTGGPGLQGYNVFRGGVKVNSSIVTKTSYADTSVSANTGYSYTVVAVDTAGNSSTTSTAATVTTPALPDTTPPSAPSSISAKANSSNSVTISWGASTDSSGGGGINDYYVLRSLVGPGSGYTTLTSVNATSYTDTSVNASTTYSYEIEAHDAAGNTSGASVTATVTTPAPTITPAVPAAPSNVTATAVSTSQINLSWTDTSTVSGYAVYEVGDGTAIASLANTVNSYGLTGLKPATPYSFYIVAINGSKASSNSSVVAATTQAVPPSSAYAKGTITGLNKCLDNYYNQAVNFNKIELWGCNGTGAQVWTYNPNNGTIVNSNGYCLDVLYDGTSSGTQVDLYQCNGTPAQVWSVKSPQGVPGAITSPHSGLCLDDKNSGTRNGNQIWIYTCNGTGAQKWTVN
jgi:fibronectin type 3 domain-containing protein